MLQGQDRVPDAFRVRNFDPKNPASSAPVQTYGAFVGMLDLIDRELAVRSVHFLVSFLWLDGRWSGAGAAIRRAEVADPALVRMENFHTRNGKTA